MKADAKVILLDPQAVLDEQGRYDIGMVLTKATGAAFGAMSMAAITKNPIAAVVGVIAGEKAGEMAYVAIMGKGRKISP